MHFDHYRYDDEYNEINPNSKPDDATSVPLSSLRSGAPFSTVTGWRGLKSDTGHCYSYADGSVAWFDPDTPCWEIEWGVLPAKAIGSGYREDEQDACG